MCFIVAVFVAVVVDVVIAVIVGSFSSCCLHLFGYVVLVFTVVLPLTSLLAIDILSSSF